MLAAGENLLELHELGELKPIPAINLFGNLSSKLFSK